ncbi:MAG: D-alanyl-D-alanine carboxypeptidase family protein [Desulfovibrio sp.]|nr:D-alanyl-D-alanine carboxypeptidase family protein [Desulfovibrio sp.]
MNIKRASARSVALLSFVIVFFGLSCWELNSPLLAFGEGRTTAAPNKKTQEMNMLRRTIVTRQQRLSVAVADNGEPMVKADKYDANIVMKPGLPDMGDITGNDIYVRDTVARMLARANEKLRAAGLNLIVAYGYRAPAVQEKYWRMSLARVRSEHPDWPKEQLDTAADAFAADPAVAGHITGGCVDVSVERGGEPLDMGVDVDDISAAADVIRTFSDRISAEQMSNRMVLYQVMTEVGFMPFFGEYWHFMYGDREWAYFSGRRGSLYDKIDFRPASP